MSRNTKICKNCGEEFSKPTSWSYSQFEDKKYCDRECYRDAENIEAHGKSKGTKTSCKNCGEEFERSRHKQEYCGVSCANKYQYETGYRDKDEQTKKANTAMRKQGMKQFREDPTTKISKRGYKLIYIPSAHPELESGWMKMHHFVWWKEKGELPPVDDTNDEPTGKVMHHKDGDKLNNDIGNLEILSNDEHTSLHSNS